MQKTALKISGLIVFLVVSAIAMAQKTDKVYLRNGDVLTGEIKSLKLALLNYNMDGPGYIDIKWEYVIKISSDKKFQITLKNGQVLLTTLDSLFLTSQNVTIEDLVEIVRIKDRFLQRMSGDISLGFNYAKSNSNLQFNFSNSTTYRIPKKEFTLKLNSVITSNNPDSFISRKQDASVNYFRILKKSYFLTNLLGWQENTELGILNRFLFTSGAGKIFINNNHQRFQAGGGLSFNMEESSGDLNYTQNLDFMAMIMYKQFKYSAPKLSIDAVYLIYPSITDWGRVRMDLQLNLKKELFKDFNVGLSFYDSYDSRPPAGAASKNDYGVNFTISYMFGK
jgi:Protein of unknown function, DUF481